MGTPGEEAQSCRPHCSGLTVHSSSKGRNPLMTRTRLSDHNKDSYHNTVRMRRRSMPSFPMLSVACTSYALVAIWRLETSRRESYTLYISPPGEVDGSISPTQFSLNAQALDLITIWSNLSNHPYTVYEPTHDLMVHI